MSVAAQRPNPYVGPRSFKPGETLYGRGRELPELRNLLVAQRIVLLYSPSGAGKTSLIRAALVPELVNRKFHVRPVLPMGWVPSNGLPLGANRYTLSMLLALEEVRPPEEQLSVAELAALDLATYLDRRPSPGIGDDVLIFDQFEEVLTLDPTDQAVKAAFFAGLGDALRDRHRWALFALREDYLAGLEPYREYIPTGLRTSFRLDLLGPAAAYEAVQQPALAAGVDFAHAAVTKLVDDLRRVKVQQPDGGATELLGPYVEPVQLQVVCHRLWDKLPASTTRIGEADVTGASDVDTVLAAYYAASVAAAAEASGVPERHIRDWLEDHLIEGEGIRSQVLQERGSSAGLDNEAIRLLVDRYVLRAEARRGATWLELPHDRLIKPIQRDNAAWREANFSTLQRQAMLWEREGRPGGLLLGDHVLAEAEIWAAKHGKELLPRDRELLAASRQARRLAQMEQRNNRYIRGLAMATTAALILALALLAQPPLRRSLAMGEMVAFPTTTATIGLSSSITCDESQEDLCRTERPEWRAPVDAFEIERYEVSNRQYRLCVEDMACTEPEAGEPLQRFKDRTAYDNHPVVGVDALQAAAYCRWLGRRLPTELEWERAARGADGRSWPWGEDPPDADNMLANLGFEGAPGTTVPVTDYSRGATSEGVYNLVGNVWEWTSSFYTPSYENYNQLDTWNGLPEQLVDNHLEPPRPLVRRGGSWDSEFERATIRRETRWNEANTGIGFRCAAGVGASPRLP